MVRYRVPRIRVISAAVAGEKRPKIGPNFCFVARDAFLDYFDAGSLRHGDDFASRVIPVEAGGQIRRIHFAVAD
jgi:hypothetical protein